MQDKLEQLEKDLGKNREVRFTFMVNVTNLINWFKNRRKKKDEKIVNDIIDNSINDAINRANK